jgi:hypothetical protein
MPKTYTAAGSATAGEVYTSSAHNVIVTNVNNFIVPPMVKATKTTSQAITTGTDTLITFDTQVIDTDDMWSSGGEFTIQTTGVYAVTAQLTWAADATGQRAGFISKNATAFGSGVMCQTILNNVGASAQTIFNLVTFDSFTAGDVIRLYAFHTKGSNLDVQGTTALSGAKTQMNIYWIGRTS